MIAHFFIHRPIFAWVISLVIMLTGIGSILNLPVEQYPDIAPPTIRIDATYKGASAETVENSVVQIIEQQLTGLDGLLYFSSSSSSAGSARMSVTFEKGTDADTAQVQVQNKVAQITTRLPKSVQNEGVRVSKAQSDFLMILSLYDRSNTRTSVDVADYLLSTLQDPIARLEGVGTVQVFGAQYAMRIWVDPYKLASYNLMPSDISSAITDQNVQVSAGSIGASPSNDEQQLNATVTAKSQYQTPEQFENIIVKSDSSGAIVRLRDVARVELGSESYTTMTKLNGYPASGLAIVLAPGANALSTANRVKNTVEKMRASMPEGFDVAYPRDSTKFIRVSIEEVVKTLFEAILLVVVVMFVFLQNWRATLIPAIAVPVVLLGTFGVLEVFGYSINTLTMFAMVLSIGLLVDDAIVVVENVERIMREEKLSAMEATEKSMREITSALVGIATVLSAVFLPMAFFSGSTGVIYRQFSITIVSSMVLSVIVALTLTPALCASFLQPHQETHPHGFFGWFNRTFDAFIARYTRNVSSVIAKPLRWIVVYGMITAVMALLILRLPTGFLPEEDQGNIMVQMNLPEGASFKRTNAVANQVEHYFLNKESNNTEAIFTISGFNYSGNGQNAGMAFVALNDWNVRKGVENRSDTIASRATKNLSQVRDASIFSLNPPAIRGLGQSNGFNFQLQALADTNRETLKNLQETFLDKVRQESLFTAVRLGSLGETPQLHVKIDEDKAVALGLSLSAIDDTLSYAWAGKYVNDFVDRGRVKKVYVQGDAPYRSKPEDLDVWYVKSKNDVMTPFSSFATTYWSYGAQVLTRYNGLASYEIQGAPAKGVSSGVAMDKMEALQETLPMGTSFAWSGLSYQERLSSGQTVTLYSISILVVFLCLAALYESWAVPFSVLLVIPLGIFGAVLAASLRDLNNDVYFQVALLTTIGLSSKNAILIVEFAEMAYNQGKGLVEAAIEGAKLRLRPILMTSLAFIAGVLPLALSSGAGANSRISIGTGIIGGTLSATFLAIFLVPLFFVLVRGLFPKRSHHATMIGEV
ncbi:efflux RND transporter permease subunit [Sulfurospirillum barnesii]|uniref:Hydrophobe/amphiphile efflux-1 (HAE1) family transporter n=1 Tax=Sulfurospirillum barnesii (strain ATCC 700032 / DSM 10660 / SES-3) TaxID=760154 RepID=I3XZ94_SULBS|nr:efflux RND transporter permease subunit [Sulfurospirillum barnesii]AFL69268.1 hydrophobe/amphiphile efflux-1 (HAE1) family transporter [Sulfurospirillum barnesii SES-3]